MSSPAGTPISADDRARLDPVFMQVILDTQAQVQQTQPAQTSPLAAMFHRETVTEALQGCAMLIAGWNQGRVDDAGLTRAAKALRALQLGELADRLGNLRNIAGTED
ncbi:hypothetical protein GCM10008959_06860 [Deinococcus seoulensis]|uniref:DUF1844 domain-containing protein n=1 Tax=Deinococcus seoulensis TaxID=1837379 RepID=A0ABQ2RLZ1_9DEIO|nr:hypothetical protein [Deinococcus seoulensis]GGR48434.1 hypothetical protein GCM10008959_06860 [Deinococcus seoulensis]